MREIKRFYDERAKTYDTTFENLYFKVYDAVTWKYIAPYLPKDKTAMILDAAGGTGRWATRIASYGYRVLLTDLSRRMLKKANRKIAKQGLRNSIATVNGDITNISFPDELFDFALCEHTLFLVEKSDALVRELARVLKRKAPLIISSHNRYVQSLISFPACPTPENIDKALKLLTGQEYWSMKPNGKVKIYTYTPNEFRALLERNRFDVEKIIGKGFTMPLRISKKFFMKREYSEEILKKLLLIEFALCEKQDALGLAGALQAIAYKR